MEPVAIPLRSLSLALVLCAVTVTSGFSAEPVDRLDTVTAERRIEGFETVLALPEIKLDQAAEVHRQAATIRARANECVRRSEERINALTASLKVLGPEAPVVQDSGEVKHDAPEIIKQRREIETEKSLLEARNSACRLVILRSETVIRQAAELQRELSARRLTSQGPAALQIAAGAPAEIRSWVPSLREQLITDSGKAGLTGLKLLMVVVLGAIGWFLGLFVRRKVVPWCDSQRGVGGERSIRAVAARNAVWHLPVTMAGGAASASLWLSLPRGSVDLMIIRLALGVFAYGAGRTMIRWLRGDFSPASQLLAGNEEISLMVRARFHALLWSLLVGFVLFGGSWFGDIDPGTPLFIRGIVGIFLVASAIWVVRLANNIPALKGRFRFLRLGLVGAGLFSISAELAGFRNLANYLLGGILATLGGGLVLWILLWYLRQLFAEIVSGHTQFSYGMRAWLGIRTNEPSAELGWLRLLLGLVLWLTFGWYLLVVWDATGNLVPGVVNYVKEGIKIGEARFVPANILLGLLIFGLIVTGTVWIKAKLGKQWLRAAVHDRGSRDALVTITGYLGFVIALLVGLTLAGVSFQGLAIVAGALSLGIGFGLQNIVNNFVSGLILLFERPIKAGDYISVGDVEGFVKQIRIRSTELETLDRQNVIVPNSELIATQVTNWMLHDPIGRLKLNVGVAYGSDTAKVREVLEAVAVEHPEVVTKGRLSRPKALFMGFGDSSLDFQLRAWIRNIDRRFHVASDINFAIDQAFRDNGIEIPFPQRDIHFRSWSARAAPPPGAGTAGDDG